MQKWWKRTLLVIQQITGITNQHAIWVEKYSLQTRKKENRFYKQRKIWDARSLGIRVYPSYWLFEWSVMYLFWLNFQFSDCHSWQNVFGHRREWMMMTMMMIFATCFLSAPHGRTRTCFWRRYRNESGYNIISRSATEAKKKATRTNLRSTRH